MFFPENELTQDVLNNMLLCRGDILQENMTNQFIQLIVGFKKFFLDFMIAKHQLKETQIKRITSSCNIQLT